ncbi:tRNA (N6-isopentenyl adenosine(37)-C2)-methylthiotransferase MiaB [Tenuifilum sp.]|uniref:tRNA (N6-isopentenyl adenosine(37)-C2)-methylthiotransferase MiaB n=1 Tax=Tenuifilum sp. TaxID=2760880 RepID=UPI002C1B8F21|nr:tRNA (N6-isopentenyl adenosine(37)-C2)-methylthiotransferase MiaB [Tenuifilum sp.]HOU74645.1 tRNA (N6-isopentenyl adenosine(37)-C2)-methylthiotransferase MiaB [Tenuifilum sp.]HPP90989.1 tRNA (N6-isopentenyl adenosine(37)-C2)-methylthiotransferase MiaB [Tenuifilum sp.]HQE54045.1 tRNA (N6-isopentenyl adenosine(37)-C2)-methylthiotransferase MiaB [Tenuifilum sp.]HQG73108.1 tRNA (N6-isopentenyl adenosine(37)-C2)-methylthiotransferase MiaB [Tenuifilum sp.]
MDFNAEDANIFESALSDDSSRPKVYIETYGCQMNVNDSEVVASILIANGYAITSNINEADVILINTCSIRENAETRVFGRIDLFGQVKKSKPSVLVGVLGCMAERLKDQLLEEKKVVDLVVGPDAYRELPVLLRAAEDGQKGINVLLSREETYADISPVRLDKNGVSAFVSIMRGCNNMCSYCVVPYTRGAERSRDPHTIVREVQELVDAGYREVTLLGQNVNSYHWEEQKGLIKHKVNFSDLLEMVALVDPRLRVRFSTSHPKDLTNEVLYTMAMYENICNHIHLPVQSGSTRILQLMNRKYTREDYLDRIKAIRSIIPDCSISTDIIAGFCTETEVDHDMTLSIMREVGFDFAYMFKYSERPNTKAARQLKDDVPEEVKTRRLMEIIELQGKLSEQSKKSDLGKRFEVLIEGESKKSKDEFFGRTSQNKVVVFPKENHKIGEFVFVEITDCTPATLIGRIVQE